MPFEYKRYLASREWAILKRRVKERSEGQCERCLFGPHQDTHHLTYERIGNERLEDLQAVCRECHEFLSGVSDRDPAAEFVLMPTVRFASYEHAGKGSPWFVFIETMAAQQEPFRIQVRDDADGLFGVFAAMLDPKQEWHPYLLAGQVLDAIRAAHDAKEDDCPPFLDQLSSCFFKCAGGDCQACRVAEARGI